MLLQELVLLNLNVLMDNTRILLATVSVNAHQAYYTKELALLLVPLASLIIIMEVV